MHLLLTFDSTPFTKHLTKEDDLEMVKFIINEYGPALQSAISQYNSDPMFNIRAHYQEVYFKVLLCTHHHYEDASQSKSFRRRVIDDEGNVTSTKGRYDELVDACTQHFNSEVIAVLRGIQQQALRIFTVDVVGYENRTLKVLLKTSGDFQP